MGLVFILIILPLLKAIFVAAIISGPLLMLARRVKHPDLRQMLYAFICLAALFIVYYFFWYFDRGPLDWH